MNIDEIEIIIPRVLLLKDGVVALATIPDELLAHLLRLDVETLRCLMEPTRDGLYFRMGCFLLLLDDTVFEYLIHANTIWVHLSGYNQYVMKPWVECKIKQSDLWAGKGAFDYLSSQEL